MKSRLFNSVLFSFVLFFAISQLFARDVTERKVDNMNSWQESFDINDKYTTRKKKYNVIVTAKDKGNNVTYGGPFNIWLDPDSDLPVIGITNPEPNLRVPSNLNVVGICIDDDAVDYVELILDGDTENPVRAKGKEFWSYYIDTTVLEEGEHTIEAYGVDINGLRGKSVKHVWHLDRQLPLTDVTNYAMGTLVSGTVKLEGLVTDGNGIKSLEYSLDGGASFVSVPIKTAKKSPNATFNISIDTKKLEDGPAVMWFFARDGQDSIGFYPYLLYVDNTNPELEIVYPADKESVKGTFTVAGVARDVVGLKSLKWSYAGQSGDFEITPGNSYWVKEFKDLKDVKNGKFVLTAVDTAGNVSTTERNIIVDAVGDKPTIVIDWPKEGASFAGTDDLFVRGMAFDDDEVTMVKIYVDGAEAGTVETNGSFYKSLIERKALGSGKHTVSVSAVDSYGVEGPATSVSFFTTGDKPYFNAPKIVGGSGPGDLPYGKEVSPEQGGNIEIEGGTSTGLAEAWYTVSKAGTTGERKDLSVGKTAGKVNFSIPINTLPWGVVDLSYHIVDTMGRTADYTTCVYVSNLTAIKPTYAPDMPEILDEEGVSARISSVGDLPYSKNMKVEISPDAKGGVVNMIIDLETSKDLILNWKIYGDTRPGEKAVYEGKIPVKKMPNEQQVKIPISGMPARATSVEIMVQSGKETIGSFGTQILIARDHDSNDIEDKKGIHWIASGNTIYSKESDAYVLGGSVFAGYVNAEEPITATVSGSSNLSATVEGKVVYINCDAPGTYRGVQVRVTDGKGQSYTSSSVNLIASTEGPTFTINSPEPNKWVRNSVSVQGSVEDKTGIAALEYSLNNGESWNVIPFRTGSTDSPFSIDVNLDSLEEGLVPIDIRARNSSGQISYYRTAVAKDTTPPEITVLVPTEYAIINGQNTIALLVQDDGVVKKAEFIPAGTTAASARQELEVSDVVNTTVGTEEKPLASAMGFAFTDAAGNEGRINKYDFIVDNKSDLPVVEIQLPIEAQVVTKDFTISGVLFDDDGPCEVYYKIDNNPFRKVSDELAYSFKVEVPISAVTDNEHTITMYAVDVNGVRGQDVVAKFHVSLEEPDVVMTAPDISTTQKEIITLKGNASDKNGIKCIEVSLDNGNSYNLAEGTTNWEYTFDTRVLPDGTHVVFVRATDKYEVQSLYSTQVTLDNTKPEINLELPLDDSQTSGNLFFSGFALDNLDLQQLYISIASLDGRSVPSSLRRIDLKIDTVITEVVDMTSLDSGNYNVKVSGVDAAGNITSVSRSIKLDKSVAAASVDIYYPLNGERKQGAFTIVGSVRSERKVEELTLFIDDKQVATAEPKVTGYYHFLIDEGQYEEGIHTYRVQATLDNGSKINSINQTFDYIAYGPWVRINNFDYGDFAYDRPFIRGEAGYSINQVDVEAANMKGASKEQKDDIAARSVRSVEVSWDNGRTFKQVSRKGKWKVRIEDEDLEAGYHFMLVRAKMNNGEIAITRCIVQIDKTKPFVRIIAPSVGGRYNQELAFSGLASDDVGLTDVTIALRKGDKNSYGIPGFIQGLYLDASFWGATLWDVGFGLTFFDDNVRLQVNFGQFTESQRAIFTDSPMRYGGNAVVGFKIIANIANLPFGHWWGHDFDWLSMNFAVGASFKYFNESASGKGQMLSALIAQLEFPRAHFKKWKYFRTMSFYTEFQWWLIPSDVADLDGIKPILFQTSFGIRTNIF